MNPASHAAWDKPAEPNGGHRRFPYVLTRFVLQMVRLVLLPIDAAGPSRSRLYLHRARFVLQGRLD